VATEVVVVVAASVVEVVPWVVLVAVGVLRWVEVADMEGHPCVAAEVVLRCAEDP